MSEWKDISTAPHETPILMAWFDDWQRKWEYKAGLFSHGKRYGNGWSNYSEHGYATHWMELPTPPVALGEGKQ